MLLAAGARDRSGYTLVELLVVVSLVAIFYAIASTSLGDLKGRYRLNAAARELAKEVEGCRVQAITENRECAVVLTAADPAPEDGNDRANRGAYEIRLGDAFRASSSWTSAPEGLHDLHDGPGAWPGVSIEPWTPLAGPPSYGLPDAVVLSPRGFVLNAPTDFHDGVIRIVLRNKSVPFPERRVVRVDRGGGTRIAQVD
jgi:prepilin-type N-terminal cleavage/methylation domain-containing protein